MTTGALPGSASVPPQPARLRVLLERARRLTLTIVDEGVNDYGFYRWVIKNPAKPLRGELWLYWHPEGNGRGGHVACIEWDPIRLSTTRRSQVYTLRTTLWIMAGCPDG